jgi:hypothetical protein
VVSAPPPKKLDAKTQLENYGKMRRPLQMRPANARRWPNELVATRAAAR